MNYRKINNKLIFKFNGGRGAILCNNCFAIVYEGSQIPDKYKNVIDSYNPISPVIARYFDLKKSTVSNYRNCIDRGIRHFNVCKDTLILTVRRDRILMGYLYLIKIQQ